jgi:hypothetical protein
VTQTAGSTTKSPELLARYCDTLLRKGFVLPHLHYQSTVDFRTKAVDEIDLEDKFNQIMVFFHS